MAVNDVLGQLQVLLKKSTPLIETGGQTSEEPLRFSAGQQVQARVLSALPNGRFLVLVDDRHLDLNLPRNTQPGANVELRFVGNQPRPTFILANELAQTPARGSVSLSDTARFIGALLDKANQLAARPDTPLARSAPVLNGAPADVQQFAVALRTALSQSGLFYESHQAQWATGQRSLGELLKEPQAQLSDPRAFTTAAQSNVQQPAGPQSEHALAQHADGRPPVSARQEAAPVPAQPAATTLDKTGESSARVMLNQAMPEDAASEPVHRNAMPLVQQQLDTLDSRQVMWQGQVWPGQIMQWQIEERDAREGEGAEAVNEWQTNLSLTLPHLGEVGANLRVGPSGIRVVLSAATAETAQRLQAATGDLKAGFDRAGLNLMQVAINQNG